MVYSTSQQVRAIVDTDITDAEITELIEEIDDLMDLKLDTGSLTANVNRAISRTWTAYRCMLKDPNAQGLGEYREDRTRVLELLKAELEEFFMIAGDGMAFRYGYADLRWPLT